MPVINRRLVSGLPGLSMICLSALLLGASPPVESANGPEFAPAPTGLIRGVSPLPNRGAPVIQPVSRQVRAEEPSEERVRCPNREELQEQLKPIHSVGIDISIKHDPDETLGPNMQVPPNCSELLFSREGESETRLCEPRGWAPAPFCWKAPGLVHRPLYFEDVSLERYGYQTSRFLQPVISGAKFFGTLPILPYKMGVERPRQCIYTLGYYRPGTCAPQLRDRLPFELDAAAFEAGAVAGLILLIP